MKLEHFPKTYTKINSKWIKDLNVSPETTKLLEKNIVRTLSDINQSKILYDPLPMEINNGNTINNGNKNKSKQVGFCTAKDTINKVFTLLTTLRMGENNRKWNKRQRIHFQNIPAAHITQYQKNKQPNQKWEKGLKGHFSKEDIQMANKHMKRCSTLLIIREMQIKTTMRYHLTLVRMAILKRSTNNKCWRDVEKREHSCTVLGSVNDTATMEDSLEIP